MIFQTSYGALKVRNLIGVTYGSSVELSNRWNMCCKQIQNYGCKRCYIEHKSFTHQILGLMSLFYVQLNLLLNTSPGRTETTWLRCFGTVYHRDVCKLGFANELEGKAVAVFLELPAPQLAVPLAAKTQKLKGGLF
ncbi:uncharacterized protein LOC128923141 isoform X2 [Zeugodacus cucurbitae]|uniref:uncharacterized protein LOC128923141 isoform X2 n=1 Tax=Zeugodacus cucurbitae TaxID=28588 RepID=UPI0023D8E735|nr:uncharacterized protein LOC128923141 isoform X2 [Zeugodacus cucurbitae]